MYFYRVIKVTVNSLPRGICCGTRMFRDYIPRRDENKSTRDIDARDFRLIDRSSPTREQKTESSI